MSSLNYSEFCRLCLVKERVSTPIFEGEGDVRRIFLKIATCLPIKVSREDHLPKSICDDCLYKVENQYQFWNTTANSEKQLHQWLGSTPGDSIDVKNVHASGMDPMEMKQESMDMDQGSELSKSLSRVEAVIAEEAGRVAAAAHGEDEDEEEEESEEEGSNSEESEDDDNDADEPNKEDDDEDEAYDEELEPTTFVNVSLACDEAGPSGTQQTSVAPSTSTSAPAASGKQRGLKRKMRPKFVDRVTQPTPVFVEQIKKKLLKTMPKISPKKSMKMVSPKTSLKTLICNPSPEPFIKKLSKSSINNPSVNKSTNRTHLMSSINPLPKPSLKMTSFKSPVSPPPMESIKMKQTKSTVSPLSKKSCSKSPVRSLNSKTQSTSPLKTYIQTFSPTIVPTKTLLKCFLPTCDMQFFHPNQLKIHERSHTLTASQLTVSKHFQCTICHVDVPTLQDMKLHHKNFHSDNTAVGIQVSYAGVVQSIRNDVLNVPEEHALCSVCSKGFKSVKALNVHRAVHRKKKNV